MQKDTFNRIWTMLTSVKPFLKEEARPQFWWVLAEYDDVEAITAVGKYLKTSHDKDVQPADIAEAIQDHHNDLVRKRDEEERQREMYNASHDVPCQVCLGRGCWYEWWHHEDRRDPAKGTYIHKHYKLDKPPLNADGRLTDDYAVEVFIPCDCAIGHKKYPGVFKELDRRGVKR